MDHITVAIDSLGVQRLGVAIDIEKETLENNEYRRIVYTDYYQQLVLMSLLPDSEIGWEKHQGTQFIRIEQGTGFFDLEGIRYEIKNGAGLIIPPNTYHNIVNTGVDSMKLYTLYSPPQH